MDELPVVCEILAKKRYSRCRPHSEDRLGQICGYYASQNKPIALVGFWGVGFKNRHNWADLATCEFLAKLRGEIEEVYPPGIELTFILSTLHGVHNGIEAGVISSYAGDIERLLERFNFKHIRLEHLWRKHGISFERIDTLFEQRTDGWWHKIESTRLMEYNARKLNTRLDPRTAAQKYYIMRDLEKPMLEDEFANCIFFAFSDSRLRCVYPDLPTLYLYARKGWSNAPWYVTE